MSKYCCALTKNGKVCKKNKSKNSLVCSVHKPRDICTICLETCTLPKKLECNHSYCTSCISKWIYLENNYTCPLCRKIVSIPEQRIAFNYCYNNKLITKVIVIEYILEDDELNEFISGILSYNSEYSQDEWNIFRTQLFLDKEMYSKFYKSVSIIYEYYKRFDVQSKIIQGKSVMYNYKINLI